MSWEIKYRCQYYSLKSATRSKIEILEDGFAGSITELTGANDTFNVVYNKAPIVIGSEATFRFITTQDQVATLDSEFLTSPYQDKKLKFYADGTNLTWVGWIKPSNSDREYHSLRPIYQVAATDSLGDLKDIPYDLAGNPYDDTVSLLTIIKRCIALGGITDNDFFTQINTYETSLMTSAQNPLTEVDAYNGRFYSNKDGEITPLNAHDVLEYCLKDFNCKLFQNAGYWYIVNDQEYNSYRILYNWNDLSVKTARAESDRSLDVNSYLPFEDVWSLSKVEPLKRLRIVFRDRGVGDNEITNGDFTDGTTGWTNSGFETFADGGGYLRTAQTDFDANYFTRTSAFSIASFDNGDYLTIRFKVKLESIAFADPGVIFYPAIVVKAVPPDGIPVDIFSYVQNGTGTWLELEAFYLITGTGDHNVRFSIEPYAEAISAAEYHWDDIEFIHEPKDNTVFDGVYNFVNSASSYDSQEEEVILGDTLYDISIGSLTVGGTITETWNRYGLTDEEKLINLMGQQIINDRGSYKDRLKVTIYDPDDNINYGTILLYNSKYYKWTNYSKNYFDNYISGEIEQVLTADATLATTVQSLTSTDGKTAQQIINNITITGTSKWLSSGSNIYYSAGKVVVGASPPSGNVGKFIVVGASQAPTDYSSLFELSTGTGIYNNEKLVFGIEDGTGMWIQAVKAGTGFRKLKINPGGGAVDISVAGTLTTILGTLTVTQGATFSSTITTPLTASRALVTGASSQLAVSATTSTEIALLSGLTSTAAELNLLDGATTTAANDFLVGSGSNTYIKKTLAETKVLVNYWVLSGTNIYYSNDVHVVSNEINIQSQTYGTGDADPIIYFSSATAGNQYLKHDKLSSGYGDGTTFILSDSLAIIGEGNLYVTSNITVTGLTASRATVTGASKVLTSSATTAAEIALLSGLTATAAELNLLDGATTTAANDFLVGSGSGAYIKKTLAETKTILGVTNYWTLATADIYYSAGMVGIGLTSGFATALHVRTTTATNAITVDNAADSAKAVIGTSSTNGAFVTLYDTAGVAKGVYRGYAVSGVQVTLNSGTIALATLTASRVATINASQELDVSTVTTTELSYVSGVTSAIQTQFAGKEPTLTKGNLTATSPVAVSATRQVIGGAAVISMAAASAGVNGYMTGANMTIFDDLYDRRTVIIYNTSGYTLTTSYSSVSEIELALAANKTYVFQVYAILSVADVSERISLAMNYSGTFTHLSYDIRVVNDTFWIGVGNDAGNPMVNDWPDTNDRVAVVRGVLKGTNAGTLSLRGKKNSATHAAYILLGTSMFVKKITP